MRFAKICAGWTSENNIRFFKTGWSNLPGLFYFIGKFFYHKVKMLRRDAIRVELKMHLYQLLEVMHKNTRKILLKYTKC